MKNFNVSKNFDDINKYLKKENDFYIAVAIEILQEKTILNIGEIEEYCIGIAPSKTQFIKEYCYNLRKMDN